MTLRLSLILTILLVPSAVLAQGIDMDRPLVPKANISPPPPPANTTPPPPAYTPPPPPAYTPPPAAAKPPPTTATDPMPAASWSEYRPTGGGYRIELPGSWTVSSEDVKTDLGPIAMNMATVDLGSRAYMAIHSVFPQSHIDRTPAETLLNNARDGAVRNVKGTLLNERRIMVQGNPGRHILVQTPDNRVSQRFVLVGNKLIQAIYVGAPGDEFQPNVVRFFNSFTIQR